MSRCVHSIYINIVFIGGFVHWGVAEGVRGIHTGNLAVLH